MGNRLGVFHLSSAVQFRAYLYNEIKEAKRRGFHMPKEIFKRLRKEPHNHEEYIWLYRFLTPGEELTLIDVGGNSGYWSADFLSYFPNTHVYAFEPVHAMYEAYIKRFENDNRIKVFNTAIGDEEGQQEINVAEGFGLTSFLRYGDDLEYRNQHFTRKELVALHRLDQYKDQIQFFKTVVKVDVQGFETKVVDGGMEIFAKADLVILECTFVPQYRDQEPTFGILVEKLRQADLHPVQFGSFDRTISSIAFERNVLFVKGNLLSRIWDHSTSSSAV